MIRLLCGENDFELTNALAQLRKTFDGETERYDATDLTAERLADIFAGQTLFALKRQVIIDTPSANPEFWQNLSTWADRLSDDTVLVLVEPKPDKRTTAYKWLKKHADIQEFGLIDERNSSQLIAWVKTYAEAQGLELTDSQARRLIGRAGNDQSAMAHAIDKLALLDEVTDQWIDDSIDQKPSESVFALFETALNGDTQQLQLAIASLRLTEEPYRLLALLSSQVLQLAVLVYGHGDISKVAADTGAKSSYPLQKLAPHASRLSRSEVAAFVHWFADVDTRLKTSDVEPWLVIEHVLQRIAAAR